jgi:hypothetical protein
VNMDARLQLSDAASVAGVPPGTVRNWRYRAGPHAAVSGARWTSTTTATASAMSFKLNGTPEGRNAHTEDSPLSLLLR